MVAVPAVIVVDSSTAAVPVAGIKLATFVTGSDPAVSFVRRPAPIALMPAVAMSHWIPIPVHPEVARPRCDRSHAHHARGWWRPDPYSQGHLAHSKPRS